MKTYEYFGCIAYTVTSIGDARTLADRELYDYVSRSRIVAVNEVVAEVMALELEKIRLRESNLLDASYPPEWQVVTIREVKADTPVLPMLFDVSQI